jgi:hypothetical protein
MDIEHAKEIIKDDFVLLDKMTRCHKMSIIMEHNKCAKYFLLGYNYKIEQK